MAHQIQCVRTWWSNGVGLEKASWRLSLQSAAAMPRLSVLKAHLHSRAAITQLQVLLPQQHTVRGHVPLFDVQDAAGESPRFATAIVSLGLQVHVHACLQGHSTRKLSN